MEQEARFGERRALAGELRRRRGVVVEASSRRAHGLPDGADAPFVGELVDALAAAVELGSPGAFAHHARASAAIVRPRGVPPARFDALLGSFRRELGATVPAARIGAARAALDAAQLAGEATDYAAPPEPPEPPRLASEREQYVDAALGGRRHAALAIVRGALDDDHALYDVYTDLIGASLYEVGRRWARGRITVADEHLATAVTGYVLTELYASFAPRTGRGAAVVACAPTETHQVGAHIVADALELDGWDVRFLGANASPRAVVRAIEDSNARLVALSATLLPAAARAARLIERLRTRFGADAPQVIVGGLIVRAVPELGHAMGADAVGADVRGAVRAARACA